MFLLTVFCYFRLIWSVAGRLWDSVIVSLVVVSVTATNRPLMGLAMQAHSETVDTLSIYRCPLMRLLFSIIW